MVIIDTDVLLLAFAFQRDQRQAVNEAFLEQVQADSPAITIYNLMELLGKLSFNLSPERLDAWPSWLVDAYQLTLVWPFMPGETVGFAAFRDEIFTRPFVRMRSVKMPFMDSLILNLAERFPDTTIFVTWNARHFQTKSIVPVMTPAEYLANSLA
jgi:hypothetical protein